MIHLKDENAFSKEYFERHLSVYIDITQYTQSILLSNPVYVCNNCAMNWYVQIKRDRVPGFEVHSLT